MVKVLIEAGDPATAASLYNFYYDLALSVL